MRLGIAARKAAQEIYCVHNSFMEAHMDGHTKRWMAGALFPRYSVRFDKINRNARFKVWLKETAGTVPTLTDRASLYKIVVDQHLDGAPIDYVEFGVFKGASLRRWMELCPQPESRFYGFDSFEGLPEPFGGVDAGSFDVRGELPTIADQRVQFVKGWFQETLPVLLRPSGRSFD